MVQEPEFPLFSRRTALKTTGAGLAGLGILSGSAVAHPKPQNQHNISWGEGLEVGDGSVRTYATTNKRGKVSSIGVHIDSAAMEAFNGDMNDEEAAGHLHLPEDVDTHQYVFAGFHYNPAGHPPPDVYTVPHFDFHFYMQSEESVEDIEFDNSPDFSMPEPQMPDGYFADHVVVPDMGLHLLDGTAPEFNGGEFTHTMVYGSYDTDGDGTWRVTFHEPMITLEFLNHLDDELEVEFTTPERYYVADDYAQQYVIKPDHDGGVYVSLDDFAEYPGPSE